MIASGREEGVSADWDAFAAAYRQILDALPRTPTREAYRVAAEALAAIYDTIAKLLEEFANSNKTDAKDAQSERHIQNSKPDHLNESETAIRYEERRKPDQTAPADPGRQPTFPLNVVLQACPDVMPCARSGIKTWRDMVSTAELIRSLLCVSPSAWADARTVFGEKDAATILVGILQRAAHISSPGGYLRDLTERGRRGGFSPGPMIMALLREQIHGQQRASS